MIKIESCHHEKEMGNFVIAQGSLPPIGEHEVILKNKVKVTQTAGKTILYSSNQFWEVEFKKPWKQRTLNQNSTLRGIEHFIGWINFDHRPNEEEKEIIHEAMLELYSPSIYNEITKTYLPKRTKQMSTKEMAHLINNVFNHLASMDIPHALRDIADGDMTDLFKKWYAWKNSQKVNMFIDKDMTCVQYKKIQKVCEFTFAHEGDSVHLEQMHIISRGADKSIIDEPWNWIRGRSDIHRLQHQHGWPYIINLYPHIKEKIERAITINASLKSGYHEN